MEICEKRILSISKHNSDLINLLKNPSERVFDPMIPDYETYEKKCQIQATIDFLMKVGMDEIFIYNDHFDNVNELLRAISDRFHDRYDKYMRERFGLNTDIPFGYCYRYYRIQDYIDPLRMLKILNKKYEKRFIFKTFEKVTIGVEIEPIDDKSDTQEFINRMNDNIDKIIRRENFINDMVNQANECLIKLGVPKNFM